MQEIKDEVNKVSRLFMEVCAAAQIMVPPVIVLNGLMHTLTEYLVRCTVEENLKEEGQKRFDELSVQMHKLVQDFFLKYTGKSAIIEFDPPKK